MSLGADRVPAVVDESCRLPWDGQDRLMRRDGYRYEVILLQHDFNHKEPRKEKCGFLRSFLGCFYALMESQSASDT